MLYKVSVIIPVYKSEKYIEKCISSILGQTLENIEIILIDDGSPDRCSVICDEFAQQYDNVVAFHIENGGPSRARNTGLQRANGKYIGFVDSDDYIEPEMYETLYRLAEDEQSDMVMCSYSVDDGERLQHLEMDYKYEYNGKTEIVSGLLSLYSKRYHNGLYSVCNKLFNNNLLQMQQIRFNEDLIRAEDAWFVFEYLKAANRVRFIDKTLYFYRQVQNSTMHTIQKDRYERSKKFRHKLMDECELIGITIDANEFYYEFLYEALTNCRVMIKQGNVGAVREVLDDGFFLEACRYRKYLPSHLKLLCFLEIMHLQEILIMLLWFWSLV